MWRIVSHSMLLIFNTLTFKPKLFHDIVNSIINIRLSANTSKSTKKMSKLLIILHRLIALKTFLVQASDDSKRSELKADALENVSRHWSGSHQKSAMPFIGSWNTWMQCCKNTIGITHSSRLLCFCIVQSLFFEQSRSSTISTQYINY